MLPGLHDHHVHILATAALTRSLDLSGKTNQSEVVAAIRYADEQLPDEECLRIVGYDERAAGIPDRSQLDGWLASRPIRLQDRTGALWVLNSAAMAMLPAGHWPSGAERVHGKLTGRFWREDRWLQRALALPGPDLSAISKRWSALGVTYVTDAGARNGPREAAFLAKARRDGQLRQKLHLMGDESLLAGEGYELGPLKLLLDERHLPSLDELTARIRTARTADRRVAAHCVTLGELAFFIAALDASGGACPGDRIEHGSVISRDYIPLIRSRGLAVVINPIFIRDRGQRYLETIPPSDLPDLYRMDSLRRAGVHLCAGSDGPYGSIDPWAAMAAAIRRETASGDLLSREEALTPLDAFKLWLTEENPDDVSWPRIGDPADLMVCGGSMLEIINQPCNDRVELTLIDGDVVYAREPYKSLPA